MATGLDSEGGTAEEIVGRVIGLYQRRFLANRNAKKTASNKTTSSETSFALTEVSDEAKEVGLSDLEFENGKGTNRANDPAYRDPSLLGPELSEDAELNDWLWSLVKTMRAGNDNEKLYPPGTVYIVENYTVFVSGDESKTGGKAKYSRKEGRRIILRAVDDVETRFSEPVFGRTSTSLPPSLSESLLTLRSLRSAVRSLAAQLRNLSGLPLSSDLMHLASYSHQHHHHHHHHHHVHVIISLRIVIFSLLVHILHFFDLVDLQLIRFCNDFLLISLPCVADRESNCLRMTIFPFVLQIFEIDFSQSVFIRRFNRTLSPRATARAFIDIT